MVARRLHDRVHMVATLIAVVSFSSSSLSASMRVRRFKIGELPAVDVRYVVRHGTTNVLRSETFLGIHRPDRPGIRLRLNQPGATLTGWVERRDHPPGARSFKRARPEPLWYRCRTKGLQMTGSWLMSWVPGSGRAGS